MVPAPAEVLQRCGTNPTIAGERDFELLVYILRHHYHPDIGMICNCGFSAGTIHDDPGHKDPPQLSPAGQYALRQCGGMGRAFKTNGDEESFPFLRRDFLAAFVRFHEEGGEPLRMNRRSCWPGCRRH
jgi:hypothetical protein